MHNTILVPFHNPIVSSLLQKKVHETKPCEERRICCQKIHETITIWREEDLFQKNLWNTNYVRIICYKWVYETKLCEHDLLQKSSWDKIIWDLENNVFSSKGYDVVTQNNVKANNFHFTIDLVYNVKSFQCLVGDFVFFIVLFAMKLIRTHASQPSA